MTGIDEPNNHDEPVGPEFDELTARLAAYGQDLQGEIDQRPSRAAAPLAGVDSKVGPASLWQGNLRKGVLVAAVLALITGLSFTLATRDDSTSVKVASESTEEASAVASEGDGAGGDETESTVEDEAVDPVEDEVLSESVTAVTTDGEAPASDDGEDATEAESAVPNDDGTSPSDATGEPEGQRGEREGADVAQPECAEGELVGDRCRVLGDAPDLSTTECPAGPTFGIDDQGCFEVVPVIDGCQGDDEVHDDQSCRRTVAKVETPAGCREGTALRQYDNKCTEPANTTSVCINGTSDGDLCAIVEREPIPELADCPDDYIPLDSHTCSTGSTPCAQYEDLGDGTCKGPGEVVDGIDCVAALAPGEIHIDWTSTLIDDETCGTVCGNPLCIIAEMATGDPLSCPDGSSPDAGGVCTMYAGADYCPEPYRFDAASDRCFRYDGVPFPVLRCPALDNISVVSADHCWVPIDPPCPTGAEVACLSSIIEIDYPGCSLNAIEDDAGRCVVYEEPERQCLSGGELGLDGLSCVIVSDPLPGTSECPDGDDVIETDGNCYRLTERSPCGDLAELADGCRNPVDPISGEPECATGYEFDNGDCVRWEEPIG